MNQLYDHYRNTGKVRLAAIVGGLTLGVFLTLFPGAVFLLSLSLFAIILLWRFLPEEDKPFLFRIFIAGVSLRVALYIIAGLFSIFSGKAGWLIGDSWGVHNYAWALAQYWHDGDLITYFEYPDGHIAIDPKYTIVPGSHPYGFHGLTYLLGFIYYIFGPMKFSARFISFMLGPAIGLFTYGIAKQLFGKKEARIAAVLTVFLPSLVLWSLTFMKDTPYIFASCMALWGFLRFLKTKGIRYIIIVGIGLFIMDTLRPNISVVLIGSAVLAVSFIFSRMTLLRKTVIILIAVMILAPLLSRIDIGDLSSRVMSKVIIYNRGVVNTGGYVYRIFNDRYYRNPSEIGGAHFLKGLGKGVCYFLLVPFPWKVKKLSQLCSYPQMILWYFLMPFMFIGLLYALRYKGRNAWVICAYLLVMTSVIALTSANVGTVFRHRDMVMPFYLIFAAVGIFNLFQNGSSVPKQH